MNATSHGLGSDRLPDVDFHRYRFGNAEDRAQVCSEIRDACEQYGFFYLVGHGVPAETIAAGFDMAHAFFRLPVAQRLACRSVQMNQNRGYQPLLETRKVGTLPDIKESFDMGYPFPADDADVLAALPFHGANVWPALPAFRGATEALYFSMLEAGRRVLEAMAEGLAADRNFFVGRCSRPSTNLRMVHYPQQPAMTEPAGIGAAPHTDRGLITLLLNDRNGGLHVQGAGGLWIDAPPRDDALIVNVGDLMTRWTNGRFRSALHRVINTSGTERMSIPQFHHPDYRTVVDPADLDSGRPTQWEPVVAGEFVASKFRSERRSWSARAAISETAGS